MPVPLTDHPTIAEARRYVLDAEACADHPWACRLAWAVIRTADGRPMRQSVLRPLTGGDAA